MKAKLMDRSLFCDDRGTFENIAINIPDLGFYGKRTYVCKNFEKGTVRGFHYHQYEAKVFICLKGAVKFVLLPGAKSIEEAEKKKAEIFVLTCDISKALYIPSGYANAWQSLICDTTLLGISSSTMEESRDDDIRFHPRVIEDLWEVSWR